MKNYDHKKIEKKWQGEWEKKKIYQAKNAGKGKKFYGLIEFPYPSGAGLHVGHIRSNTAMDIISRKRRMEGYNVLYPIGWDAFGLPTENYAIKTGKQPEKVTKENTDMFRKQLKAVGFSFDWSREVNTTDPAYYKWTQWIFLQMYKKGLAYKTKTTINWCPKDKIGLANEEVVNGRCDRCDGPVEKREKEQWMLAITKYADRLDKDLDDVNYLEKIKIQQRNWIGKSEGLIFSSPVKDTNIVLETFSTHFEAFFADTFVVIAPDHKLLPSLLEGLPNKKEILVQAKEMVTKRNIQGFEEIKEVEGIFTGRYTLDPIGNGELPIWIANYALADYGTGIVKCSCHDERDFAFAKKYNIKLKPVLLPVNDDLKQRVLNLEICFTDTQKGIIIEPEEFKNKNANEYRKQIADYAVQKGFARKTTKYKLRDWVFSRQRYWGEPIPLIHCADCGYVPVPEKDLPVKLPKVKSYQPTDNGESPLATISKWVNVKCPKCKGPAKRETDTMPNWAGSSWYFLRYTDSKNKKEFASKKNLKYWTPVDWYNGGMEHTTLHLLYSRFWHKFLYDLKLVPTKEPYMKRTSHGMILAEGGEKMSKSKGNTVDPKDIIEKFGADTLRLYEMFIGSFDQSVSWSSDGIVGPRRFIEKVWRIGVKVASSVNNSAGPRISRPEGLAAGGPDHAELITDYASFQTLLHKTIKKVSEDIESMSFNTAVSTLMVLSNEMDKMEMVDKKDFKIFLQLLAPFIPHVAEELWHELGEKQSIHLSKWPKPDLKKIVDESIKIAIQVNSKVRAEMNITPDMDESLIKDKALKNNGVLAWIKDKQIKKVIYVKDRLVNIVV
jgi:leucyl-tRNA synthetase